MPKSKFKLLFLIPPKIKNKWVTREEIRTRTRDDQIPEPPYLLPQVSALLKNKIGVNLNIEVLDAQLDNLSPESTLRELHNQNPDLIICVASIYRIQHDRKFLEQKIPIISIISPISIPHKEAIDIFDLKTNYIVRENVESTVLNGVQEFINTGEIKNSPGFIINKSKYIFETEKNNENIMKELPCPDFENFRYREYMEIVKKNKGIREGYMITSKGCIFNCNFCVAANWGEGIKYKTPEQVVDELEYLHNKYSLTDMLLQGSEFSINKKRGKRILKLLIERNLNHKISLDINDKPELIDKEYLKLMNKAGVKRIRLGVESADKEVLDKLNKSVNLDHVREVVKFARELDIKTTLFFTVGLLGETSETIDKNADFIIKCNPDSFTSGILFLTPGSPWYEEFKTSGDLLSKNWMNYRKFEQLPFAHNTYKSMEEIKNAEKYLKRKVYFYWIFKKRDENYILKVKRLINSFKSEWLECFRSIFFRD